MQQQNFYPHNKPRHNGASSGCFVQHCSTWQRQSPSLPGASKERCPDAECHHILCACVRLCRGKLLKCTKSFTCAILFNPPTTWYMICTTLFSIWSMWKPRLVEAGDFPEYNQRLRVSIGTQVYWTQYPILAPIGGTVSHLALQWVDVPGPHFSSQRMLQFFFF